MKKLALISKRQNTSNALAKQLQSLLKDKVSVTGYYLEGNMKTPIMDDLVVITSQQIYHEAKQYLAPGCPVIVARRSINYHEIDQLFTIPSGTEVLLVSDLVSTTVETILLLETLGINHIKYYPCAPDAKEFPHLKIAVTTGQGELVPAFVEQVIDIGHRNIDFTTLVEILSAFSLLDNTANLLSATYVREIIEFIKQTKQMADRHSEMQNQLQIIINRVHDGIIAVDDKNNVTVINSIAAELLNMTSNELIGKKLSNKIVDKDIYRLFLSKDSDKEKIAKINNRQWIVNAASIMQADSQGGKIYTFKDVTEIQRLEEELRRNLVRQQNFARYTLEQIIGDSEQIQRAKELARKMASSESPILIQGESGTGKELFAQGIHNVSSRRKGPFIAVNFAALTESLLESELFGYSEGSFTGAKKGGAPGLFEQAHKGTIFLDEIGDAPLSFQVKLLRVLQEKQVRRIGSARIIPVDVRVITATNIDLKALIQQGKFREDLYYRLKVLPIKLPPLRDRKSDILVLANVFYREYCKCYPAIKEQEYFRFVAPYLMAYDWPGNIRELQNVVEHLVSLCPEESPTEQLLPEELLVAYGDCSKSRQTEQSVVREIMLSIARANAGYKPIGRRSLAMELGIPESAVRRHICYLESQQYVAIARGRKGLELTDKARLLLQSSVD